MTSLFRSRRSTPGCPVEPGEQARLEMWILWLNREFGSEPLLREPLQPRCNLFPVEWNSTPEDGAALVGVLSEFMLVDPGKVETWFYADEHDHVLGALPAFDRQRSGPAGLYTHPKNKSKYLLGLDASSLRDPVSLIATICHELGHVKLLGEGRLSPDEADHEVVTDLLVVYFGGGVFTANAAFQFRQWSEGTRQGWQSSRLGYLSEEQLGFALAGYAFLRGEASPRWSKHLAPGVAHYFRQAGGFLSRGGSTMLRVPAT